MSTLAVQNAGVAEFHQHGPFSMLGEVAGDGYRTHLGGATSLGRDMGLTSGLAELAQEYKRSLLKYQPLKPPRRLTEQGWLSILAAHFIKPGTINDSQHDRLRPAKELKGDWGYNRLGNSFGQPALSGDLHSPAGTTAQPGASSA